MFPNTNMFYMENLMTESFYFSSIEFYCVDTTVEYRKIVKFASILAEGELSKYLDM